MICPESYLTSEGREQAGNDALSRIASKWIARRQQAIERELGCSPEESRRILRQRWERTWSLAWEVADEAGEDLAENVDFASQSASAA